MLPSFGIEYTPASNYGTNFGFFLDAGGEDDYFEFSADGEHKEAEIWRNDRVWQQPAPDDERFGYNSRRIGMDVEWGPFPNSTASSRGKLTFQKGPPYESMEIRRQPV